MIEFKADFENLPTYSINDLGEYKTKQTAKNQARRQEFKIVLECRLMKRPRRRQIIKAWKMLARLYCVKG